MSGSGGGSPSRLRFFGLDTWEIRKIKREQENKLKEILKDQTEEIVNKIVNKIGENDVSQ